jgi:hypothetical protein
MNIGATNINSDDDIITDKVITLFNLPNEERNIRLQAMKSENANTASNVKAIYPIIFFLFALSTISTELILYISFLKI